jgi:hypothetical protein
MVSNALFVALKFAGQSICCPSSGNPPDNLGVHWLMICSGDFDHVF